MCFAFGACLFSGCLPADPFPLPCGEAVSLEAAIGSATPDQYQILPALQLAPIPIEIDCLERLPAPERITDGHDRPARLSSLRPRA